MKLLEFEQLCRDASEELGVADTGAFGQGFPMRFDGVLFETTFREERASFLVTAELGTVSAPDKSGVYENLLTIQTLAWDRPRVRFGFDPWRQAVLLCVEASDGPHLCGAWLAMLVRQLALQVAEWRETLLAGRATAVTL